MASIKNMLPDECTVLRDGAQKRLMGPELVPGDILYIRMGDKLPADVRLVEVTFDTKFDRSILTGMVFPAPSLTQFRDAQSLTFSLPKVRLYHSEVL